VGDTRPDLFVDGCLVVEVKAVDHLGPIHLAQAAASSAEAARTAALLDRGDRVVGRGARRESQEAQTAHLVP
jgi:hypothetical protein